jgi:hypothetical protein
MNRMPMEKEDNGDRSNCLKHPSHRDRIRLELRAKQTASMGRNRKGLPHHHTPDHIGKVAQDSIVWLRRAG